MLKGFYKHYKGTLYEVLHFAKKEGTLEDLVVYKGPSIKVNPDGLWVRPWCEFIEEIQHEGKNVKRFEKLIEK